MLKVARRKFEPVKYLSTSAIMKKEKPENLIQPSNATEDKKEDVVEQKLISIKNLYASRLKEEEKITAKEKLKNLIKNMPKTTKDNLNIKTTLAHNKRKLLNKAGGKNVGIFEKILTESVKQVAEELGGDTKKTESDLLDNLKLMEHSNGASDFSKTSFKTLHLHDKKASAKVADILAKLNKIDHKNLKTIDFDEGLDIFSKRVEHETEKINFKIWEDLEKEEIKFLATSPPRNHFEELMLWTEQKKLWHFPVDNDQGMDEEAAIDFTEHVFLENHLEPWCPKKGPLRHFMNLVLVGLSKNPYLTVKDKKEHIYWFRDYFENKRQLLKEVGAFTSIKDVEPQENNKDNI